MNDPNPQATTDRSTIGCFQGCLLLCIGFVIGLALLLWAITP